MSGSLIDIGDTKLYVEERGTGLPLLVLHGGPGMDHTMFGAYLDALSDSCRLLLVDQRAQGRSENCDPQTWTIGQMAADVTALAGALGLDRYAVLGHSFGAFVALQHAVDFSGQPAATIVSSGVPSERFLMSFVEANRDAFEPAELREQIAASWEAERTATDSAEIAALLADQLPFHFNEPYDPRIADYAEATSGAVYSADVLRHFANEGYGGIEVEARLGDVRHPVLVLAGRHDRVCSVEASETIAAGVPGAQLTVFEESAHMTFVEQNAPYIRAVADFLGRHQLIFSENAASSAQHP